MDCMTATVTANCIASSDKVMDELKRVWKEKFAAQYRSYSGSNFKKLRHTQKNPQSGQSMSRPKLEPNASRLQLYNFTATIICSVIGFTGFPTQNRMFLPRKSAGSTVTEAAKARPA
jgi:hypothetical protein